MKRSEMVTMISQELERCHDRYGNLHNFKTVADFLLETIEENGMEPPCTYKNCDQDCGMYLEFDCDLRWEEE
jgi:hypothetical protein